MQILTRSTLSRSLTLWLFAGIVGTAMAVPSSVLAQERSRDRRDITSRESRDHDSRDRDERHGRHDEAHIQFTHSSEGRHFDNGVTLRKGVPFTDRHFETFFPHHYYSYPHYVASRASVSVSVVASPFHFYFGIFPPYIERRSVIVAPPSRVFIEIPVYVNNEYHGYGDARGGDYYLVRRSSSDDNRWKSDPDLKRTVYDLEDAFRGDDITLLTSLTDPATKIAIFAKGHYEYSVEPNDYLDMTRDFMRTAHTTGFDAYSVRPKSSGVYQVFAKHSYKNQDGQTRVVYLCVAVERIHDRWTITQIDTSPDRIEN